ncbi:hypothetical protein AC1031_012356 [Aphanomyces cochlioides]|nr:hypothetical protein AC1031_012356 [Aphanomyces cochlioides]
MRLGIAVALVATSAVVALRQADQASPVMLSRRVDPLDSMAIDVERQLWGNKNKAPRPATGPKEEKGRKYGGRIGKVVGGSAFGAAGGAAGGAIGTALAGPGGTAAGTAGGAVAGVYTGTRLGARVGQKVGGAVGRQFDKKDARVAASGGDKKPGFFGRLADKFKGKKSTPNGGGSAATTPSSSQRQPGRKQPSQSTSDQFKSGSTKLTRTTSLQLNQRQAAGKPKLGQVGNSGGGSQKNPPSKHTSQGSGSSSPARGKLGELLGMRKYSGPKLKKE